MKKRIFTNLIMVLVIALLAFLSIGCGESLELEKPKNVKYDGNTISWNKVENAEYYTVCINDGDEYEVSGTVHPYVANGQTFTVKITAVSALKKLVKSESTTMSFMALDSVADIRINLDGSIEWDPIANATAYLLKVDGNEIEVFDTKYTELEPGSHSINVKPIVSGNNSFYASWMKTSKNITICGVVSKDSIKYQDGHIQWGYVQGAQFYEIRINGQIMSSELTGTSYQYDASNNSFDVEIRAIGNHSQTFDGQWSETKKFIFLDTVTNVDVVDGNLVWSAINGATGYKIKLNGVVLDKVLEEPIFTGLTVNKTTEVQIMPISSDSTYFSNWSSVKSVLTLAAPVLQWNSSLELDGQLNNNLYWDKIANSAGYAVRITLPNGVKEETFLGETQVYFAYDYKEVGTYIVEVKTLASPSATGVYDSLYSNPIKVIRLDAPKPVENNYIVSDSNDLADGFEVTFQSVAGATSYRLYKDDVFHLESVSTQFDVKNVSDSAAITEQSYNFKIQSLGSERVMDGIKVITLNSLTSKSLSFDITVLATPSKPTISGFSYTYGAIDKNNGYAISVGSGLFFSENTTYDLSGLEAGNYSVKVCAKGNGSNVLASNYSAPITVHRLEAPTNIKITTTENSDGTLSWEGQEKSSAYHVVFNNDGNSIRADQLTNVNQYITEQGTQVYMTCEKNQFDDVDPSLYHMSSQPSQTVTFIRLAAPTFGDVAFSGTQLIWKSSSNINTNVYTPTYEVYDSAHKKYNGEINGTTMDLSFLEGGDSYTFYIRAIGNGTSYVDSADSTPITIFKLKTPEVKISESKDKYEWAAVPRAVSYIVYVDGVEVEKITHTSGTTFTYTPSFKDIKTYKVEVQAIGDGGYETINSNKCIINQEIKQLNTPNFTFKYSEDAFSRDGNIVVTVTEEPANNNGYSYTVGDITVAEKSNTYSFNPHNTGEYYIKVYALGGKFDDNGVYYYDSQTQGGNESYKITLLGSINKESIKLEMDGYITWAAVSGAIKYEVELSVDGAAPTIIETTKTTYEIPEFATSKQYSVKVRALGNGNNVISAEVMAEAKTWYPS